MYTVQLTESFFPAQSDAPFRARTIASLLDEQAREDGERLALREILPDGRMGREWTYAQLRQDAMRLGRALAQRHPRGARIAVFADNRPEWVLLELAAGLAGLTLVTVNPSFGARELTYVLKQSQAEAIYHVESVRGSQLGPIVAQARAEARAVTRAILLTDHAALFDGENEGALRETAPEDVVQIQYTSGTTGFPKGALLHQKGLIQSGIDILARDDVGPGTRVLHHMPLFHSAGCAILVLGSFGRGATVLLAPGFDPVMLVDVIERERPQFIGGVPTMMVALMEAAEKGQRDLTCVQNILSGGSMVAPELVRKARAVFGAPIQIIYGQTEASPGITGAWAHDSDDDLAGTIGQPYPHIDVSIRDPATNTVLPIGAQGEICCRGFNVMSGYNDNPEASAAAIDSDGWLHTGDLGTMDARGYLKITGRVKEMIIRGGENLFPAEIENALLEHPDLLEVAVVGVPDERWGEQVACFMRPRGAARPSPGELKAFIRERLSPQKTPAYWIWVDAWPLTGSGKIQKFALRDAFEQGAHQALTA
ncbi:MAG: class I adenylate-forming enzyme family protein [Hyphomonadaceae bacterium]